MALYLSGAGNFIVVSNDLNLLWAELLILQAFEFPYFELL